MNMGRSCQAALLMLVDNMQAAAPSAQLMTALEAGGGEPCLCHDTWFSVFFQLYSYILNLLSQHPVPLSYLKDTFPEQFCLCEVF